MGDDCWWRTQKYNELRQQGEPDNRGEKSDEKGGEESDSSHASSVVVAAGTKRTRNEVAGAVSEEKTNGLDEGHVGKGDANSGSGLGRESADESGVDNIVESSDHHADHGGDSKTQHQPWDWCLRHFLVF